MSKLSDAILFEGEAAVLALLAAFEPVNVQDDYGYTPLIEAVIVGSLSLVQLLVSHQALLEQEDISGMTALQWAVNNQDLAITQYLLDEGADPNHFSTDGQSILVNPLLRRQTELVRLLKKYGALPSVAEDFIEAKLIGHRFELLGHADIVDSKGAFVEIDFEGFYQEFTTQLIYQSLKNYLETNCKPGDRRFKAHLARIVQALDKASELVRRKYARLNQAETVPLQDVLSEKLLIIPVAYEGHAICFIKYGKLLAKCDRGVKKLLDTVIVYEMPDEALLDLELLYDLVMDNKTNQYIHYELNRVLKLKPLYSLPLHTQLSGNCSWANMEAVVPAALAVLSIDEGLRQEANTRKAIINFFNDWTNWDREQALKRVLETFEQLSPARQACKVGLLGSILIQRCVYLKPLHIRYARMMIPCLSLPAYRYVLDSYLSVYGSKRGGRLGQNLLRLLKLCDVPIDENVIFTTKAVKLNSPLHAAVRIQDMRALRQYIEQLGVSVDLMDETGSTPLMYAAWLGWEPGVRYLLQKGATVNSVNHKNASAKHYALFSKHATIVSLLDQAQ